MPWKPEICGYQGTQHQNVTVHRLSLCPACDQTKWPNLALPVYTEKSAAECAHQRRALTPSCRSGPQGGTAHVPPASTGAPVARGRTRRPASAARPGNRPTDPAALSAETRTPSGSAARPRNRRPAALDRPSGMPPTASATRGRRRSRGLTARLGKRRATASTILPERRPEQRPSPAATALGALSEGCALLMPPPCKCEFGLV